MGWRRRGAAWPRLMRTRDAASGALIGRRSITFTGGVALVTDARLPPTRPGKWGMSGGHQNRTRWGKRKRDAPVVQPGEEKKNLCCPAMAFASCGLDASYHPRSRSPAYDSILSALADVAFARAC